MGQVVAGLSSFGIYIEYLQEQELKRAKHITDETERKYEEILRKIAVLEADLEKAEERADDFQTKFQKADNANNELTTSKNDPGRIRTHNLLIWSQMRYRCATEPNNIWVRGGCWNLCVIRFVPKVV